jgi:uncharacterized NAD(P)/FAD-binding protein YdhS
MEDKLASAKVPEPSKLEVEIAIEKLSERFHRAFTYDDAAKFVTLNKELEIWRAMEDESKNLAKKNVRKTQKIYKEKNEKISRERAALEMEKGLIVLIAPNVLRITKELEDLVGKYR